MNIINTVKTINIYLTNEQRISPFSTLHSQLLKRLIFTFLLFSITFFYSCQTTDLPPMGSTKKPVKKKPDEIRIWKRSEEEQRKIRKAGYIYRDPTLTNYISEIGNKLIPESAKRQNILFEFKVFKHPTINAFAYPNGKVYIHIGLLARLENEAQFAMILAHEITHAVFRHTVKFIRTIENKLTAYNWFQIFTVPLGRTGSVVKQVGMIAVIASVYGYSREMEEEADQEGLKNMVKAGYNPIEAPKVFKLLSITYDKEEKKEPFLYRSHPTNERRKEYLNEMINKDYYQMLLKKKLKVNRLKYLKITRSVTVQSAEMNLQMGRPKTALAEITKALKYNNNDPKSHYLKGKAHIQIGKSKIRAVKEFEISIKQDPKFPKPYRELGIIYFKMKKYKVAKEYLTKYLKLAPNATDKKYMKYYLKRMQK